MRLTKFLAVCFALWICWTPLSAQKVIKLATLAPKDSTWHKILENMGQRWKQASNGQVILKIFPGTQGDESDIMRKIRVGQLQAGAVTTVGLGTIDATTQALHIPLAFESSQELDFVHSRIAGRMESALSQKGYVVLNWGEAGWVRFFTSSPVAKPDDLRKLKLCVWATGTSSDDIWKDNGFHPVSLSTVDILPSLQTGMINAIQVPALAALSSQWFAFTKYMTDLPWAPLTGATIVDKKVWESLAPDLQKTLADIARETGVQLQKEIRAMEQQAIDAMVKRGLQVIKVPPEGLQQWHQLVESIYPRIRGTFIPPEVFDEVMRLRNEYRRTQAGAGTVSQPKR